MVSKEYTIRTRSYAEDLIPDTVLDKNDPAYQPVEYGNNTDENCEISQFHKTMHQANEKMQYQISNNIQPGTPEWFRLWFSNDVLTNPPYV